MLGRVPELVARGEGVSPIKQGALVSGVRAVAVWLVPQVQVVDLEWGVVLVIVSQPICAKEYKTGPNIGTDNYTRMVCNYLK